MKLFRYGAGYRAAESKLSWLYRVAERCCFDHQTRHGTRDEGNRSAIDLAPAVHDVGGELEGRNAVLRFLRRFEPRVQTIALLYFLDGLSQKDIAATTRWSRQTGRAHYMWTSTRVEWPPGKRSASGWASDACRPTADAEVRCAADGSAFVYERCLAPPYACARSSCRYGSSRLEEGEVPGETWALSLSRAAPPG